MTPLPVVSGREAVRALERGEFEIRRSRGSHRLLAHANGARVVIPVHGGQALPKGTLRSILRQARLSVDDFVALLD